VTLKKIPVNELYIRSNPLGITGTNQSVSSQGIQDIRFYDLCQVNVATTGLQGSSVNIGELYVIYDIELCLPILEPLGNNQLTTIMQADPTVTNFSNNFLPNYNPYGFPVINPLTNGFKGMLDKIGIVINKSGNNTQINFPQSCAGGIFEVIFFAQGTSTANVVVPTCTFGNGCTQVTLGYIASPLSAETNTAVFFKQVISIPNMGTVNWGNTAGVNWPYLGITGGTGNLPNSVNNYVVEINLINNSAGVWPFVSPGF